MGCEGGQGKAPDGAAGSSLRTIAAFRTTEAHSGVIRKETLVPDDRGLNMRVVARTFSGIKPTPFAEAAAQMGPVRFHETPQIPIVEFSSPPGEVRI